MKSANKVYRPSQRNGRGRRPARAKRPPKKKEPNSIQKGSARRSSPATVGQRNPPIKGGSLKKKGNLHRPREKGGFSSYFEREGKRGKEKPFDGLEGRAKGKKTKPRKKNEKGEGERDKKELSTSFLSSQQGREEMALLKRTPIPYK